MEAVVAATIGNYYDAAYDTVFILHIKDATVTFFAFKCTEEWHDSLENKTDDKCDLYM